MKTLVMVILGVDDTDEEIRDYMHGMKKSRLDKAVRHLGCLVDGFNDDKRELYDIPEVRVLCQRLLDEGFISYLDVSTTLPGCASELTKGLLGAAEVYMLAKGLIGKEVEIETLRDIDAAVREANQKADALCGPM